MYIRTYRIKTLVNNHIFINTLTPKELKQKLTLLLQIVMQSLYVKFDEFSRRNNLFIFSLKQGA